MATRKCRENLQVSQAIKTIFSKLAVDLQISQSFLKLIKNRNK